VEIGDFSGEEKPGGIVLRGACKTCGETVARFVEDAAPQVPGDGPIVVTAEAGTFPSNPSYTSKQGQYLAFIHYSTKVNGQPPAESDFQRYFQVSPPTVHAMLVALEKRGFISRVPGRTRSISLNLQRDQLPDLE
jgi:repressor LexA